MIRRLVLAVALVAVLAPLAFGFNGANRLCWDRPAETDVTAYRIFLGTVQGVYTFVQMVPILNATAPCGAGQMGVTLGSLGIPDGSYYAVVRAVDGSGNESLDSAEAIPAPFPLDQARPGVVTGVRVE